METSYPILLAEDDPNDVHLILRAFQQAQIINPVQIVHDGEQAIAYLAGTAHYADRERYPLPAVLLLDLKLPRRTGFEVLSWLRERPSLRRLPVVVLSSSNDIQDINRAYTLGANSYLVKPVRFDALLELMAAFGSYWLTLNETPELH